MRLKNQRITDVARSYGYRGSSGAYQFVKRLEHVVNSERTLRRELRIFMSKMDGMSNVRS